METKRWSRYWLVWFLLYANWYSTQLLAQPTAQTVTLTETEQAWLLQNPTATLCVNPDWTPFGLINVQDPFESIGADLVALVASRAGIALPDPLLTEPNVIVTHQDHAYVTDLEALNDNTVALSQDTSVAEHLRKRYPNLQSAIDIRWVLATSLVGLLLLAIGALWWRLHQRATQQRFHLLEQHLHIEQRNRALQNRLVAMLSHELRTPVSVIAGATQSLEILLPTRNADIQLRLERIRVATSRIVDLTDQFLLKDRVDQDTIQLRPTPINPTALCSEVMRLLDSPRLHLHAPETPPCAVWADGSLLQVAIDNLLRNALKYADPDTPIDLHLHYGADHWALRVRNQGPNIPKDMTQAIFEPYTRGMHPAAVAGAGIGLYVVSRVAALHQGTVTLTCNTVHTIEFTLHLPYSGVGGSSAAQA